MAGSIGPTNRTLSISPDVNDPSARAVTFDQMRDAYRDQVRGLIDGGVDMLLIETITDTLNTKAALVACERGVRRSSGVRLPIMISVTITDRSGRTLSGQTVEAFWTRSRTRSRSASASTARSAPATWRRTSRSSRGIADTLHQLLPECRPAERVRRLRRAAAGDRRRCSREFADARLAEHRRRLLRDHAGAHRGDREASKDCRRAVAQAKARAYDARESAGGSRRPEL